VDVENWTKNQSDLFGPGYRKPNGDPDINAYFTDTLSKNKALAEEQRTAALEAAGTWDGKASD